jgi:dienelactone hydrolase
MSVIAVGKYDIPVRGLVIFTLLGVLGGAGALIALPPPKPVAVVEKKPEDTDDVKKDDIKTPIKKTVTEQPKPPKELPPPSYPDARLGFATTLSRTGPAPGVQVPVKIDNAQLARLLPIITFPSGDLMLKGIWGTKQPTVRPPKKPGVVLLHDGFTLSEDFLKASSSLRSQGFVVIMPALRGENGNPGTFSLFYDEVDDVFAAADHLSEIENSNVDPEQLFVAGYKEGGTLALLAALADTHNRFKGVAVFGSFVDPKLKFASRTDDVPFDASSDEEWRMRTPLAFLKGLKVKTRIYFPTTDGDLRVQSGLAKAAAPDIIEEQQVAGTGDQFLSRSLENASNYFKSLITK